MGKKMIVVSAFAVVAIFASYAASDAQFGAGDSPVTSGSARFEGRREQPADFAQVVNQFKDELTIRIETTREAAPKDIELMKALDKYLADDKLDSIIKQLEQVKATFPGTDEANKAEGAIQVLKGRETAPTYNPSANTDRDPLLRPRKADESPRERIDSFGKDDHRK